MFVDGVPVGLATPADSGAIANSGANFVVGATGFRGEIDEVRVSNVAREPAWLAAQHAAMRGELISLAAPTPDCR